MKHILQLKPITYILLAAYFVLGFSTLAWGEKAATWLYAEDHYFENVGALSLFIASGICFYTFILAYRTRKSNRLFWGKQLAYLGLALLFFFGAGEEISWGQRIFGIAEPAALAQTNVQGELNIHNLAIFENSNILKADTIFNVFWLGYVIAIPLGTLASKRLKELAEKWLPIGDLAIGALFVFNYALAGLSKVLFLSVYTYPAVPFVQAVQEVKESNYEFLFILLVLPFLWEVQAKIREQ